MTEYRLTRLSRRRAVAALGIVASISAQKSSAGTLIIRSRLPAQISVNGRAIGIAEPGKPLLLQLPPGSYSVEAERLGYQRESHTITVMENVTTEVLIQLASPRRPRPEAPKKEPIPKASPKVDIPVPTRLTGRALLSQSVTEEKGYGLYSYLLFRRRALWRLAERRSRYIAAIESYLEIETVNAVLQYAQRHDVNITYLPVVYDPQQSAPEPILQVYDYARAQRILSFISIQSGDGPFIIGTRQPLSGLTALPSEHLIQDLSSVPARIVTLWVRLFMQQASRERFWERDRRDDFLLRLRTYIGRAGENVDQLATSLATVVWRFESR